MQNTFCEAIDIGLQVQLWFKIPNFMYAWFLHQSKHNQQSKYKDSFQCFQSLSGSSNVDSIF